MAVIDSFISQISEKSINIGLLKDVILNAIKIRDSLFIYGKPGIGKSSVVQQVVEEINNILMKSTTESEMFLDKNGNKCCFELIDIRLSSFDSSADIVGLPDFTIDEFGVKRTKFSLPNIFPSDPKWKGIIFFDEMDNAEPSVLKACYQIIQDRRINDFKFPDGVIFIAAGNGDNCQGFQTEIPQALKNRFTNITVDTDLEQWIVWALKNNIDSSIITFLKSQHPELLFDESALKNNETSYATPRGWSVVSKILQSNCSEVIKQIHINGRIGYTTGTLFWSYYKKEKKLPNFEDILNGIIDVNDNSLDIFYNTIIGCINKIIQQKDLDIRNEWVKNLSKSLNKLVKNENLVFAGKLLYQTLSTKDTSNEEFSKILQKIKNIQKNIKNAY